MIATLRLASVWLVLLPTAAAAQEDQFAPVYSATLENQNFDHERIDLSFDLVNNGTKPITMFNFWILGTGPDGVEHRCNGMGQDMITWIGPPPGVRLPPAWNENWIQPREHRRITRSADSCLIEMPTVAGARAQLDTILFDDGTGEGDPTQIALNLSMRRDELDEMKKWAPRFVALLQDPAFGDSALRIYQDLIQADHEVALNPDLADTNRERQAKAIRDRLKRVILEVRQYSKTGKKLSDNSGLTWRIQTVEIQTSRLVRGTSTEH